MSDRTNSIATMLAAAYWRGQLEKTVHGPALEAKVKAMAEEDLPNWIAAAKVAIGLVAQPGRANQERIKELEECVESLIYQFGIVSKGMLHSGALSAMEQAFEVLGWPDPCPAPKSMVCDEPGCLDAVSCGWPSPSGYRNTCGKHYRDMDSRE